MANPKETVNISLTQIGGSSADLIGAAVTITDDDSGDTLLTATWNGSIITAEIDINTNYTVSVETIAGYLACAPQYYQAVQLARTIIFQYRGNGVFLEDTNHQLYTSSGWDSSKTINGIVIITGIHNYRFSVTYIGTNVTYSSSVSGIRNYITQRDPDYQGQQNTNGLANFEIANNLYSPGHVGCDAQHFLFPDLKTRAYAATITQLQMVYDNKTEYTACLSAIGSTYNGGWHTTSSLRKNENGTDTMAWVQMSNFQQANYNSVRAMVFIPVSDYE